MYSLSLFRSLLGGVAILAWMTVAQAGPAIQHWTAPTGARVYFVESHALPILDIRIDFVAGSEADPTEKAGLAELTQMLLETGAGELNEQAIADRLADLGASISGEVELDRSSLSLRTLTSERERDATVELAALLLAQPTFPADVLERERALAIAGLKEALTRPAFLAKRQFTASVYGAHPYGKQRSSESLAAIERDDLLRFHQRYYTAKGASIAIVGDVNREMAEQIAIRLTERLPEEGASITLSAPDFPVKETIRIPNPSAQAHVLIGQPGLSRSDPDYFPLFVGNHVLGGGGFTSRLVREVREKRGYAYSVYSYFQPQQVAGPFIIGLQTRGGQVDAALEVVEQTLNQFIAEGPTDAELQAAKNNLVNGFGLRLDSNRKILGYVAVIGFYQLPLQWLDDYPKAIAKVTKEQVRDAFSRRIRSENRVTVVVGGDGDRETKQQQTRQPEK